METDYISVSEASDRLRVSHGRVWQLIREGRLEVARKFGHLNVLDGAAVERLAQEMAETAPRGRGRRSNLSRAAAPVLEKEES